MTPQHVFLTFLPATFSGTNYRSSLLAPQIHTRSFLTGPPGSYDLCLFFSPSDVQHLAAYGLDGPPQEETKPKFGDWSGASSFKDLGGTGVRATKAQVPILSVTPAGGKAADS